MTLSDSSTSATPPAIWRILCAMLYDALLVIACIMVFGFIMFAFNRGEVIERGSAMGYALQIGMVCIWAGFFAYFWSRQSQTLGMRAWRLVVTDNNGHSPTFARALLRWLMALLTLLPAGIGLWWRWLDADRRSLYDRLSGTRMFVLARNPYR
ncbi:RDD family protein [Cardiobacteriaceae bacterium TAE3-ERU3]|nr:RDD family protein [Cardiobacteriaceae bacterium TAE3-ERU3]